MAGPALGCGIAHKPADEAAHRRACKADREHSWQSRWMPAAVAAARARIQGGSTSGEPASEAAASRAAQKSGEQGKAVPACAELAQRLACQEERHQG